MLGVYHLAGEAEAKMAVEAALAAQEKWAAMPWEERAAVFLRIAELISGKYRALMDVRNHALPVQNRAPSRNRRCSRNNRFSAI